MDAIDRLLDECEQDIKTNQRLMGMKIDLNWNKEFATIREGEKRLHNGNHELYKCPAGYWTVGHGYNIQANGLPDDMAKELLRRNLDQAQELVKLKVRNWDTLAFARRAVLIDMCFNMGIATLSKFKKFFAAIEAENFEQAAAEMEDSKWFKQVGIRAEHLQEMMRTGELKDPA